MVNFGHFIIELSLLEHLPTSMCDCEHEFNWHLVAYLRLNSVVCFQMAGRQYSANAYTLSICTVPQLVKNCARSQLKRHRCGPVAFCTDHRARAPPIARPCHPLACRGPSRPFRAGGPREEGSRRAGCAIAYRAYPCRARDGSDPPCLIRPVSIVPRFRLPGESEQV